MPVFYGAIDLGKNELRNAVVQNLGAAPSSPIKGQLYYDSTANMLYWWNGTTWIGAAGSALTPAATVTTQAVGDAPVVGASANYAREDHKHGREAFGAVVAQIAFGSASANGAAATISRSDHAHGTPTHDNAAHSAIPLSAFAQPIANVNMGGYQLIGLVAPTQSDSAASKSYVDTTAQGLDAKQSVKAASTGNLALNAPQTVDGIALVAGDRVLVKDQTTPANNGIYVVAAAAWTRALDMDAWTEIPGAFTFVEQGTLNADNGWVCTADQGGTLGTTAITWTQFSGAGQVNAGAGLTKTGNTIDAVAGDTSLTVNADELHVNTAVIATVAALNAAIAGMTKKYATNLVGTASPEVITHNLNTRDIQLTVLNGASPYTAVEVDWDATTANTVTIRYNPNLGAGYRVVVVG